MIGSSKNNRENYPRKCFRTQERETRVKFYPRLSANQPSNNWAQGFYNQGSYNQDSYNQGSYNQDSYNQGS